MTYINSPLEQFEVTNLISLNVPIFGFLNFTLTNFTFYSLIVLILVISLYLAFKGTSPKIFKLIPLKWSIALESSFASINAIVRERIRLRNEIYLLFITLLYFCIIMTITSLILNNLFIFNYLFLASPPRYVHLLSWVWCETLHPSLAPHAFGMPSEGGSSSSGVKLILIYLMCLIFFVLLLMEYIYKASDKKIEYHSSGLNLDKNLVKMISLFGAEFSFGYFMLNKNIKEIEALNKELYNELTELRKQINELSYPQMGNTTTSAELEGRETTSSLESFGTQLSARDGEGISGETMREEEILSRIDKLEEKIKILVSHTNRAKSLVTEQIDTEDNTSSNISSKEVENHTSEIDKSNSHESMWSKLEDIKRSSSASGFNFWNLPYADLINDLLGGIGLLLFSQLIITVVISIVFIFFGEYLIQRFELEKKYPKLAKIIQLRRKFQRYYLIMNICYIIVVGFMLAFLGAWFFFT